MEERIPDLWEGIQAQIKVVGIGSAGNNALNRMISEGIDGVDFIAMNTDVQALSKCLAPQKLNLGPKLTRGLGAGLDPDKGKAAAEESVEEIRKLLEGSDLVFITAGLGGGTGTGASPVVAQVAKELGALVVAVVSKPHPFIEGTRRYRIADEGLRQLSEQVDALIPISNENIFKMTNTDLTLDQAFSLGDQILMQGVKGISEIILKPGFINVDFADVRMVLQNAGTAVMGIGSATGDNRAEKAAQQAISSPLLEFKPTGASRLLYNITVKSGHITTKDIASIAEIFQQIVSDDALIKFGVVYDDDLEDSKIEVTLIASEFKNEPVKTSTTQISKEQPVKEVKRVTIPEIFGR
ncbi:cell division protein FtsZ [Coprothermobacter platensis]|uniref:cell division protein FtsZ n=1 Tax=Coprothermobacter platensis TaxID=108819 RepID=UPI0003667344|nr:cell division protein FtsZ [Coprothermobacter platensis]